VVKKAVFRPSLMVFKRWSRRKYGILASVRRQIRIGVLCVAYSLVNRMPVVHAQADTLELNGQVKELEQIEVAGHRSQAAFSPVARVVTVIQGEELEKAGVQSVADVLEFLSQADIRQRGMFGVQSDISIRGSSFDHVMVLVNGVNLSDAQTGHAAMDIPVDPENIERVEVIAGSAARTLGAGAFSGAVNVVTRRAERPGIAASLTGGEHGLLRSHIHASLAKDPLGVWVSAGRVASEGYAADTDFDLRNAYLRAGYNDGQTMVDVQAGVQDKKFGAAGFYSPRFPNQYEETGLWFASLRASTGSKVRISPVAYWRHRSDHYLLDRDNPSFYENYHLTDIQGIQLNMSWKTGKIFHTVGVDMRSENILSNNLGYPRANPLPVKGSDSLFYNLQYGRTNYAWFQEHNFRSGRWFVSGGLMLNWNTAYPNRPSLFPGAEISFDLRPRFRLFGNVNRSLHLPTFTDLFYTDPVNQGNTQLRANRMMALEGGFKVTGDQTNASITVFHNQGHDLVDWVWSFETRRFSPLNLADFRADGVEIAFSHTFQGNGSADKPASLKLYYSYMTVHKSTVDSVSKYNHLRHKLSLVVTHRLPGNVQGVCSVSFQDRAGERIAYLQEENRYDAIRYTPYWLVDYTLNRTWQRFSVFATVTNLFNVSYADAGSAVQPGRWFRAGISVSIFRLPPSPFLSSGL
jgi:vitamin B12 transporter